MKLKNILVASSVCGILAVAGSALAGLGGGNGGGYYLPTPHPIIIPQPEPQIIHPRLVKPEVVHSRVVRPEIVRTMGDYSTGQGNALREQGAGDLVHYDFGGVGVPFSAKRGSVGGTPLAAAGGIRHYGSAAGGVSSQEGAYLNHTHGGGTSFGDIAPQWPSGGVGLPIEAGFGVAGGNGSPLANTGETYQTSPYSPGGNRRPFPGGRRGGGYNSSPYGPQPTGLMRMGDDRELAHFGAQYAMGHVQHQLTAPIYTTVSSHAGNGGAAGVIGHPVPLTVMPNTSLSSNHMHQNYTSNPQVGGRYPYPYSNQSNGEVMPEI